jgi:hypothetical protein
MITRLTFNGLAFDRDNPPPLSAGEAGFLAAWGDGLLSVQIECIQAVPPPPVVAPCAHCGHYAYTPGERFQITAPPDLFSEERSGFVQVTIVDGRGDKVQLIFAVRSPSLAGGVYA